jgi:hypothetical protein
MNITTSYDGCGYLTAGKEYEVRESFGRKECQGGKITDDDGRMIMVVYTGSGCPHIGGTRWEIVEEELC